MFLRYHLQKCTPLSLQELKSQHIVSISTLSALIQDCLKTLYCDFSGGWSRPPCPHLWICAWKLFLILSKLLVLATKTIVYVEQMLQSQTNTGHLEKNGIIETDMDEHMKIKR